jgi:hypothetical protein
VTVRRRKPPEESPVIEHAHLARLKKSEQTVMARIPGVITFSQSESRTYWTPFRTLCRSQRGLLPSKNLLFDHLT